MIENIFIILILMILLGISGSYLYKSKKNGNKCVGCPYAKECKEKASDKHL